MPLTRIKYNLQFLVQRHETSKMVDLCDNYCKYHLSIIEVSDFCQEINWSHAYYVLPLTEQDLTSASRTREFVEKLFFIHMAMAKWLSGDATECWLLWMCVINVYSGTNFQCAQLNSLNCACLCCWNHNSLPSQNKCSLSSYKCKILVPASGWRKS